MVGWRITRGRPSRPIGFAIAFVLGIALGALAVAAVRYATTPGRTTPIYDPPVLAGQPLWGYCSAGFYARRDDTIVLTSSGHCATEGTTATDPDGGGVRGVFGPAAHDPTCPYAGHHCAASDINFLVVADDRVPWGHLNVLDLGSGGYHVLGPETTPLACGDVAIGDAVEATAGTSIGPAA